MKKIREYQKEAVDISASKNKGIICIPTGCGKTLIQSHTILDHVKRSPGFGVYLVMSPRIILSYQLMRDYYEDFNRENLEFWYAGLHSGRLDSSAAEFEALRSKDIAYQHIISTTSSAELSEEIEKARKRGIPILIFSTYHSAERIKAATKGDPVDLIICDESHYLVEDQFGKLLHPLEGLIYNKIFFYTATMRFTKSESGKGMNNPAKFGEIIFQRIPREMIELGHMVRPRMHIISFPDEQISQETLSKNAGKIVAESFLQHEYISKRAGKVLVTCTGTPMLQDILASQEIHDLRRRKGVKIYAIASNTEVNAQIDEVFVNREEFLDSLKKAGEVINQGVIILHIDILTEGIDIPGITAILPFRSLKKSKFVQTLGRATRVAKEDLKAFESGKYTHKELNKTVKPYAWIIVPDIEGEDTLEEVSEMVTELRAYGFNPKEDVFISNERGKSPPVVLLEPTVTPTRKNQFIFEVIEEIRHEIEDEEIANLLGGKELKDYLSIVLC